MNIFHRDLKVIFIIFYFCFTYIIMFKFLKFNLKMKSANVFLYKNGIAKLGDMNVSKVAKQGMLYT